MADFEALNLNITSYSESASAGINSLVQSLTALKKMTASFKDTAVENTLKSISTLTSGIANSIQTLNIDSGFSSGIVNGLNQITSAVDAISDASIERIERLADALERLGGPGMPDVDLQTRTSESARTIRDVLSSAGSSVASGFGSALGAVGSSAKTAFGLAGKGALASVKAITGALSQLNKGFLLGKSGGNQFVSSLARIAKYRFLRTIIKGVTDGIKTGLQNVARYSSEANAAMSSFSTGSLYLKNSLGAALYPAIASLVGIFNTLINVVVRAINILNMFFSILGGKGTYIKAKKQTQDYAASLGGAAGAAGALKQELMGFDEINALSPSGGGGGGGGGLDFGSMFEEAPVESWLSDMLASGNFYGLGSRIAELVNNALGKIPWNKAYSGAKKAADSLSSLINGFFGKIDPNIIGQTIAGVINTGATFVADFFSETNFELIGTRVKDSIVIAIKGINKSALAKAITGKLSAAVRFLKGLLPTSAAEWSVVTDGVAELINDAILSIPAADIGTVVSRIIVGGLQLITSLGEAGTLTNITQAVIDAIKTAFSGITKEDIQNAWNAVKSDLFNALKLLADIKIEIAGLEFSGITATLAGGALFAILKSAIGKSISVNGYRSVAGSLTLLAGIGMLIESIVSLLSPVMSGGQLSGEEIKDKIGQAFVGAGFILLSAGITKGSGIALGLGIAILATYTLINSEFNLEDAVNRAADSIDETMGTFARNPNFNAAIKQGYSVDAATAISISETARSVEELYEALYSLSSLPIDNLENTFESAFGSTDTAEGFDAARLAVGGFINEYNKIVTGQSGSSLPMNEQLVYLARHFGLATESTEALLNSVGSLNDEIEKTGEITLPSPEEFGFVQVSDGANTAWVQVENLNESMSELGISSDVESEFSNIASSVDEVASAADSLPSVVILDSSALSDVQSGATEAANAVGGLTAFIAVLQRALETLGSKKLFDPIASSANTANEATAELKSTLGSMPESKSIRISIANQTSVISKLDSIKRTLSGISSKTISIQVKAGLTSGAKSFLTTLKGITSGSTAAAIGQLLSLSQFASGGFPKSGDIFMANENGRQELVGRIGSQPAVANQDQIGDAIFRYMDEHAQNGGGINTDELASAIVRGIKASGLGVVKLDGKTISGSINRETQRSGKPAIQF